MEFTNGEDRILFIKYLGNWLPIACLNGNSLSETSEMLPTTTRDNNSWFTGRPINQNYTIPFDDLQINTTVAGGNFNVASYDRLKLLKRSRTLLDWKIQGTIFPVVDYGKGYITEIGEVSKSVPLPIGNLLSRLILPAGNSSTFIVVISAGLIAIFCFYYKVCIFICYY